MANRSPAPLRTVGTVLRALLGLSLLAALVVGAPYLLLAVGHQPTELSGGTKLLTQQDDGSLFLVVLTCIGWAAWAAFAFSVLVELVAVLRRRSAPRIRGLGGMQSLASFLIGGIVLLAPTAASAATVTPAVAATVTHTVGQGNGATHETQAAAGTAKLRHTVTSATESPWELAQTYLGSGPRWKDIAALNPDIPELVAGDQYLPGRRPDPAKRCPSPRHHRHCLHHRSTHGPHQHDPPAGRQEEGGNGFLHGPGGRQPLQHRGQRARGR